MRLDFKPEIDIVEVRTIMKSLTIILLLIDGSIISRWLALNVNTWDDTQSLMILLYSQLSVAN